MFTKPRTVKLQSYRFFYILATRLFIHCRNIIEKKKHKNCFYKMLVTNFLMKHTIEQRIKTIKIILKINGLIRKQRIVRNRPGATTRIASDGSVKRYF